MKTSLFSLLVTTFVYLCFITFGCDNSTKKSLADIDTNDMPESYVEQEDNIDIINELYEEEVAIEDDQVEKEGELTDESLEGDEYIEKETEPGITCLPNIHKVPLRKECEIRCKKSSILVRNAEGNWICDNSSGASPTATGGLFKLTKDSCSWERISDGDWIGNCYDAKFFRTNEGEIRLICTPGKTMTADIMASPLTSPQNVYPTGIKTTVEDPRYRCDTAGGGCMIASNPWTTTGIAIREGSGIRWSADAGVSWLKVILRGQTPSSPFTPVSCTQKNAYWIMDEEDNISTIAWTEDGFVTHGFLEAYDDFMQGMRSIPVGSKIGCKRLTSIGHISVDPMDSKHLLATVYCSNPDQADSWLQVGIFSQDGGRSWELAPNGNLYPAVTYGGDGSYISYGGSIFLPRDVYFNTELKDKWSEYWIVKNVVSSSWDGIVHTPSGQIIVLAMRETYPMFYLTEPFDKDELLPIENGLPDGRLWYFSDVTIDKNGTIYLIVLKPHMVQ